MKENKLKFLKVTMVTYYVYPPYEKGEQAEKVIKEWFDDFSGKEGHAYRNNNHIGNTNFFTKVEVVDKVEKPKDKVEFKLK